MAHNKLYRNFIILQEDENNHSASTDKPLSGYAKIEAKSDKCKISFYAQNLKKDEKYSIVLICYKKEMKQIVDLGALEVNDVGKGEAIKEYYINDIAGLNFSYEKISGAAICKHKSEQLLFLMYGFMNNENVQNDWKKSKVIKCYDENKSVPKYEKKLEDKIKKDEEKIEKDEEKIEKDEEKIDDKKECHHEKEEKKDDKKECHHDKEEKKDDKKECHHDKEEEKDDKKECDHKKEEKKDNKECDHKKEEEEEDDKCPKKDDNKQHKHNEDYECEINCKRSEDEEKSDDTVTESKDSITYEDFDEYEKNITREKENQDIDPYDFNLRGAIGNFFSNIVKGFEEVKGKFKEIKYCKWYKVKINNIDDMCNTSDYNKYTIAYYPMLNYYPYIIKYGYFLIGYKCDSKGDLKYIVYGIPGSKNKDEQPYVGKTGFVTWMSSDDKKLGCWLMFYDYKNSNVVVPMK